MVRSSKKTLGVALTSSGGKELRVEERKKRKEKKSWSSSFLLGRAPERVMGPTELAVIDD